jgi:hypothetical protein
MTTSLSYSLRSTPMGSWQWHSAVSVPRAFFSHSMVMRVGIIRASSGALNSTARLAVSSTRLVSAMAWTERRWLRTARRSVSVTLA